MSRRGTSVYEERDYYEREREEPRRASVRTRERDFEEVDINVRREDRGSRPSFLREDYGEVRDAGPLVLRERNIETIERPIVRRPRSPSPVRIRERIIERERERSPSPPPVERIRTRVVERERERRSPTPPPQIRARVIETRERVRERSPSPVRIRERIIERERERSPSPVERTERVRIRNIERESVRAPTPSPSPSPPPPVIRAPPIHQEIITHHRHIDHGLVYERAPVPSPPPPPRREEPRTRETDIDIYTSRNNTEVDITQKSSRSRTPQPPPAPVPRRESYYDDSFIYEQERSKLRVQETKLDIHRRRSASARPERRERDIEIDIRENSRPERRERDRLEVDIREDIRPERRERERERIEIDIREDIRPQRRERDRVEIDIREDIRPERRERERVEIDIRDDEDEADYYRRKTNERAYIGEAYNGATKDWAIVDVPPGTQRVQMEGIGGASQEVTWQRYNGVRRSKFIPERERERVEIRETFEEPEPRTRERIEIRDDSRRSESGGMEIDISRRTRDHGNHEHENLEIDITTNRRKEDSGRTYEREYERIEEITNDRRVGMPRPPPKQRIGDLWTEITKDLVVKEAILELGYDFEETEFFYYIIQYLRYEDVLELVELSERIRQDRKHHVRQIERERERAERRAFEKDEYERSVRRRERDSGFVDERVIEREVIYDGRPPRHGW